MLFINPEDFLASTRAVARQTNVRFLLRKATHGTLEADELVLFYNELTSCVVFGAVGVDSRVIYLRYEQGRVVVREIISGRVTTAYEIDCLLSARDMNMELAVIDGIVSSIERVTATDRMRNSPVIHTHGV